MSKTVPIISPTLDEIASVVPTLNREQFERLVRVVLRVPDSKDAGFDPATQLTVYLYEWLVHLNFLAEDRIRWLLGRAEDFLWKTASEIVRDWPTMEPTQMLSIIDRRYGFWPGCGRWQDTLMEADVKDDTLLYGVSYFSVDLVALFFRKQEWLNKIRGGKDAERTGRSTAEPDGVRQGAAPLG